jgi:hypothetical protein|tara:strand:+ start:7542 stop:7985 length:444 start_codon:yes stop_codon:yes gene_type:complete
MDICIDFDGTCTTHEYPNIGIEIGAAEVLLKLTKKGHRLILFTMRSDGPLKEAYNWFERNKIPVYGVQSNPTQIMWTKSPKAFGHLYIDDAALGCPLTRERIKLKEDTVAYFTHGNEEEGLDKYHKPKRDYVDWKKVEELLIKQEIL